MAPSVAQPKQSSTKLWASVALLVVSTAFLVPLAWLLVSAVHPSPGVSLSIPSSVTMEHFSEVADWDLTFRPLLNSMILSLGTALLTVAAGALAAYPLSRYKSRFKRSLMYTILFGTCLPITAMMVPVYSLFVRMDLLDSHGAIILFMAATSLPMAVWMLKNFMDAVPVSLEEAAWVDGSSAMGTLWRIVLPLMRPGLVVVFIFVFTMTWGNFFVPFVLIFDSAKQPAAVAIFNFFGAYGTVAYGKLAAFSLMYAAPVLALYAISQKVSGGSFAMAGAVKG